MRHPSVQNLPNDLDPSKQVETRDRVSLGRPDSGFRPPSSPRERDTPQSSPVLSTVDLGVETHSIKTPSIRPDWVAINTNINAESLSPQNPEDLTIMQVANSLPQVEAGNGETILQKQPNQSPQDDSKNLNDAGSAIHNPSEQTAYQTTMASSLYLDETVCQLRGAQSPQSSTLMQVANSLPQVEAGNGETILQKRSIAISQDNSKNLNVAVVQNLDNTIIQYSDSAIHNPAEQTVCQTKMLCSLDMDETVCQLKKPQSSQSSTLATVQKNRAPIQLFHPSIFRDMFRASGSFASRFVSTTAQFFHSIGRKINPRQLQSRFHPDRQQAMLKSSAQTSSSSIASEEQLGSEQYQKKQLELDYCRLSFAKELARNGKFRKAIAMAEPISQTSLFFKDAQKLIQSWKQI